MSYLNLLCFTCETSSQLKLIQILHKIIQMLAIASDFSLHVLSFVLSIDAITFLDLHKLYIAAQ